MAIEAIHDMTDNTYLNQIYEVNMDQQVQLTSEEKNYTNAELANLKVEALEILAKRCGPFQVFTRNGRGTQNKANVVPLSGTREVILGKILAYYHRLRQEQQNDNDKVYSTATTWSPLEDARLCEIMSDENYADATRLIFQSANQETARQRMMFGAILWPRFLTMSKNIAHQFDIRIRMMYYTNSILLMKRSSTAGMVRLSRPATLVFDPV